MLDASSRLSAAAGMDGQAKNQVAGFRGDFQSDRHDHRIGGLDGIFPLQFRNHLAGIVIKPAGVGELIALIIDDQAVSGSDVQEIAHACPYEDRRGAALIFVKEAELVEIVVKNAKARSCWRLAGSVFN